MRDRNDGGFALPATIGALVVIGLLVTAGFMIAEQELRMGVANRHANVAFNIAQAGANEVMANWNGYNLGSIPVWEQTVISETFGDIGEWEVTIQNANNYVYFLTATGAVTNAGIWSGASRTIGIVTKIITADFDPPGALTTTGNVKVGGSAQIHGENVDPVTGGFDWGGDGLCGFGGTDLYGIVSDEPIVPGGGWGDITGSPTPTLEDDAVATGTFTDFGSLTLDELIQLAIAEGVIITNDATPLLNTTPAPSYNADGTCNDGDRFNWGSADPADPCGSHFPLIYHGGPVVAGDFALNIAANGYGQGVLIVENNLSISGSFTFNGIIITKGAFSTTGGGGDQININGAVLAANGINLNETVSGNTNINYSLCAVKRAILNNTSLSKARQVSERSWIDLTAVVN